MVIIYQTQYLIDLTFSSCWNWCLTLAQLLTHPYNIELKLHHPNFKQIFSIWSYFNTSHLLKNLHVWQWIENVSVTFKTCEWHYTIYLYLDSSDLYWVLSFQDWLSDAISWVTTNIVYNLLFITQSVLINQNIFLIGCSDQMKICNVCVLYFMNFDWDRWNSLSLMNLFICKHRILELATNEVIV